MTDDQKAADALMRATGAREVTHRTERADGTTSEATASRKTVAELHRESVTALTDATKGAYNEGLNRNIPDESPAFDRALEAIRELARRAY